MVDHPLRDEINDLAREIGELHGFTVPSGFRFYMATSAIAEYCWNVATVVIYNDIMTSGRKIDMSAEICSPARLASLECQANMLH